MSLSDDDDNDDGNDEDEDTGEHMSGADSGLHFIHHSRSNQMYSSESLMPSPPKSSADEVDDRILPISTSKPYDASFSSESQLHQQHSTVDSWLPLVNFIDLREDEFLGWRSFVEIASIV